MDNKNFNDELFEIHASFCGIFSSSVRLKIMWELGEEEKTVTDLANSIGLSITNISQHLRIMKDKGAVKARKDGRTVYCRISNPKFYQGASFIREGLKEEMLKGGNFIANIHEEDEHHKEEALV